MPIIILLVCSVCLHKYTTKKREIQISVISVHSSSLDGAAGEVEVDELWDHLEGVGLHLLQRVRVQPKLTQVRDV